MAKTISNLIADEHQAVKDYGEKAREVPAPHAKVIRHIQGEERQHAKELARIKPMAKMSKDAAFHEVFHNKPKTVDASKSAKGQQKQMIAIALSKAGLSKPGKNAKR
jgi:rubrerythrin